MKHLKLYEQYDLEDLSDEEIFGEEVKRNMFKAKEGYYAIELKRNMRGERLYLYKDFEWIDVETYNKHIVNDYPFFNFDELNDDDEIMIYNDGIWNKHRKKDLPENIKKEINDLNFL